MANNPVRAIDYFIELVNYDNTHEQAVTELSQTACLSKNYDKAETVLKNLIEKTNNKRYFIEYINILFAKNDIEKANEYIQRAIKLDNDSTEIKFLQAKLYRNNQYLTKAINIYNDILDETNDKESVYIELAEIYFLKGQYKDAIKYFEKASEKK